MGADLLMVKGEPWCFLVMEYVEGRTLRALLEDLGTVPEALVREIGLQVARGLGAIHEAGVVHRDVKPENICLSAQALSAARVVGVEGGVRRHPRPTGRGGQ